MPCPVSFELFRSAPGATVFRLGQIQLTSTLSTLLLSPSNWRGPLGEPSVTAPDYL